MVSNSARPSCQTARCLPGPTVSRPDDPPPRIACSENAARQQHMAHQNECSTTPTRCSIQNKMFNTTQKRNNIIQYNRKKLLNITQKWAILPDDMPPPPPPPTPAPASPRAPARPPATPPPPSSARVRQTVGPAQIFLVIQTNCKHFYSFSGPYINRCGKRSAPPPAPVGPGRQCAV